MSGSSFGSIFKVSSFGESHGPAVGCIVDGIPAGLELDIADIQFDLDRRRPGVNRFTTGRREPDQVQILSGVFEGVTTGAPIALSISNVNHKSKDYSNLRDKFRPGHGDYSYFKKYQVRDYLGGGRASARETVARVAAGAIAKKYLFCNFDINFTCYCSQIGDIKASEIDLSQISLNPFNFPDQSRIVAIEQLITQLQREGDSIGAELKLCISNVPAGIGEPVFDKLDAKLAQAIMSINAVKSVSIGDDLDPVTTRGSIYRDQMDEVGFISNHAGGILAGISTGADITLSAKFKAPASVRILANTIDTEGNNTTLSVTGRHDVCVGYRAVPIVEAMAAMVVLDQLLIQRGRHG